MNGYNGYYKDPLEAYDGDEPYDDESAEAIPEFNPFDPIGVAPTIGRLLSGGSSRRTPVRYSTRAPSAPGVRDATLHTPRGNAQLRLPEEVVTKREFEQVTQQLQEGLTKAAGRVNTIEQQDLPALKKEVGTIVADTRKAVADEKVARRKEIAKLREEQRTQQSTSSIFNLILLQQLQKQLAAHSHKGNNQVPDGSSAAPAALSSDNNSLLLLSAMGGFGGSGSSRDSESPSGMGEMNPLMWIVLLDALK
jgi:chaperonin cofactor prefoldin